jgi:hypothetical protein
MTILCQCSYHDVQLFVSVRACWFFWIAQSCRIEAPRCFSAGLTLSSHFIWSSGNAVLIEAIEQT